MYTCSECGKSIGRFDAKNPPVCNNGRVPRVAEPTVLATNGDAPVGTGAVAGSPTFQGDTLEDD